MNESDKAFINMLSGASGMASGWLNPQPVIRRSTGPLTTGNRKRSRKKALARKAKRIQRRNQ